MLILSDDMDLKKKLLPYESTRLADHKMGGGGSFDIFSNKISIKFEKKGNAPFVTATFVEKTTKCTKKCMITNRFLRRKLKMHRISKI